VELTGILPLVRHRVLYLRDDQGLRPIVEEYTQAPGFTEPQIMWDFDRWSFNDLGQVAFTAWLPRPNLPPRRVIYLRNPDGVTWPVAKGEDWIEVVPGDWKQISGLYMTYDGEFDDTGALNHSGELAFLAEFTDGSQAVIRARAPVGPGACCRGATCTIVQPWDCARLDTPRARFVGVGTACNPPGQLFAPCCRADFDRSGYVGVEDIFGFLDAYFRAADLADANGSGGLELDDIFEFLRAFFAGCDG
jgi:hypothetical protein